MNLESIISHLVDEILAEASRESLNEIWLDEAEYPESFSVDEMKAQPSKAAMIRYLEGHFGKKLGKGSGRIVFPVDKDTVLKVALNEKGVAQNEVEIDASNIGYEHIAKVHDFDRDGKWMEVERAERLRKTSEWPKLIGLPVKFNQWTALLLNYIRSRRRGGGGFYVNLDPEIMDDVEESEMFNDVVGMIANHEMAVGDMARPSSWGVVNRNGKRVPVLIDYGITPDVLTRHYWG